MIKQYQLKSFTDSLESSILIPVRIELLQNKIILKYDLSAIPQWVFKPSKEYSPIRRNEIWKNNCFELFLSKNQAKDYIEFNISPSGDWNCYEFDSYRDGMREKDITKPIINIKDSKVEITITIDYKIYDAFQITCIIERDKKLNYFSTSHPELTPDFHNQKYFIQFNN